jgi:hypothetical protein
MIRLPARRLLLTGDESEHIGKGSPEPKGKMELTDGQKGKEM